MKTELQVGHLHLPDIVPGDATKLIVLPFLDKSRFKELFRA